MTSPWAVSVRNGGGGFGGRETAETSGGRNAGLLSSCVRPSPTATTTTKIPPTPGPTVWSLRVFISASALRPYASSGRAESRRRVVEAGPGVLEAGPLGAAYGGHLGFAVQTNGSREGIKQHCRRMTAAKAQSRARASSVIWGLC